MKITFNINYRTSWGEALFIVGNIKEVGNEDVNEVIKMELSGIDLWTASLDLSENDVVEYTYLVKNENGNIKREWGKPHKLYSFKGISTCLVYDKWSDQPLDKHYYSSAFTQGIFKRPETSNPIKVKKNSLLLEIAVPYVKPDEYVAISGDCEYLGNWDITQAKELNSYESPVWSINLDLNSCPQKFSYKFFIKNRNTGKVVVWENSDNQEFDKSNFKSSDLICLNGLTFANNRMQWKGAGTAIPVFSLRSEEDFGVGDFYDLYKMIDWAVETGQNFVQILPINDTTMTHTWTDSYPYNANSTFALHPMYIRLNAVGELTDKKKKNDFEKLSKELNSLQQIDYEKVNGGKIEYLKELFAELGDEVLQQKEFKSFVEENKEWLEPYAAFCILRDIYKTPDFNKWMDYAVYDKVKIDKFVADHKKDIEFIYFIQFYLDKQLRTVRDYAHSKGVVLKGDIPIGISRTSVDAWIYPHLFNMDCQAGAPPDDFSVLGQNWGFPTYNWEEMSKDDFKWWKDRFKKMAEYFDAYRIDHILGFFRIWQIPMDAVHGLLGTFNPAMPYSEDELRYQYDFWIDKDLQTTPFIMDYFLNDFFGEYTQEAKESFLVDRGYGRYGLKEFVNTQKKVEAYFADKENSSKNTKIKEALFGLIDQVLFIEDVHQKNTYHPRISAQFTYTYRALNDYEKWCFDKLYNDFYYHRHNDFWYGKAMWKLPPLINSTDMLVCGEDLGMIPDCVGTVMSSQQILALEIQRMPKDPKVEFGNTNYYPYLSVATTSTHDMSGIRGWWEENHEKTQHFYNNMLHEGGGAPYFAEPWICDKIVSLHLDSPAMLTILPLQDWLSIDGDLRRNNPQDEQINVPANSRHYWRYRMHFTLEYLLDQKDFNDNLKYKIENSGR